MKTWRSILGLKHMQLEGRDMDRDMRKEMNKERHLGRDTNNE